MDNNTWEFTLFSMFKHSLNGKDMIYGPSGIPSQWKRNWNIPSWFIALMEKVFFYGRLFSQVVIVIEKD